MPRYSRMNTPPFWSSLLLAAALGALAPAYAGDPGPRGSTSEPGSRPEQDHPPPTEAQMKELEKARKELERARVDLERAAKQLARASGEVGKFSPRAFAYEFMANPK